MGSTLTGLVFVVVVTANLSDVQFGLWSLILSTVGYATFAATIISFWVVRQRARGLPAGPSALALAGIFAVVLTVVFVLISIPISSVGNNFFYFLISVPQIPLTVLGAVLEALILATNPERWSIGFGLFELSKVGLGIFLVAVFHLTLEGAILTIIGAQAIQLATVTIFARKELMGKVSKSLIGRTLRGAWLALLMSLPSFITGFDDIIIFAFIGTTLPLAFFNAANTFASVSLYSSFLATGLYPSILSGKDPSKSTSQILEIQLMILAPILTGTLILGSKLLNILNSKQGTYVQVFPVLLVLVFSAAFFSFGPTLEGVIMGSDRTDVAETVEQRNFLNSRLFLLAKINIVGGIAYIASIAAIGIAHRGGILANGFLNMPFNVWVAVLWGVANVCMAFGLLLVKARYVRKIASLKISRGVILSVAAATAVFAVSLVLIEPMIPIVRKEIPQTLYIIAGGVGPLVIYFIVLYLLSPVARQLVQASINTVLSRKIEAQGEGK